MEIGYTVTIALDGILLLGLAADFIGQHTFLPWVTMTFVFGPWLGHTGFTLFHRCYWTTLTP
jgi:hypothetical protein